MTENQGNINKIYFHLPPLPTGQTEVRRGQSIYYIRERKYIFTFLLTFFKSLLSWGGGGAAGLQGSAFVLHPPPMKKVDTLLYPIPKETTNIPGSSNPNNDGVIILLYVLLEIKLTFQIGISHVKCENRSFHP